MTVKELKERLAQVEDDSIPVTLNDDEGFPYESSIAEEEHDTVIGWNKDGSHKKIHSFYIS